MIHNLANVARRYLIRIGKALPFLLCFILSICYAENAFSLATGRFLEFDGYIILSTPISTFIAEFFEYDILIVIITLIVSIAIEACKWNLWATLYLGVHLVEKSYFTFELEIWQIWVIICGNFLVSVLFCYKGIKILVK